MQILIGLGLGPWLYEWWYLFMSWCHKPSLSVGLWRLFTTFVWILKTPSDIYIYMVKTRFRRIHERYIEGKFDNKANIYPNTYAQTHAHTNQRKPSDRSKERDSLIDSQERAQWIYNMEIWQQHSISWWRQTYLALRVISSFVYNPTWHPSNIFQFLRIVSKFKTGQYFRFCLFFSFH